MLKHWRKILRACLRCFSVKGKPEKRITVTSPSVAYATRQNVPLSPPRIIQAAPIKKRELPIKTLVIGFGNLGGHAVTHLREHCDYKLGLCAVDTNEKDLATTRASFRILLGKKELRGLGTGINPEISARLMSDAESELDGFIKLHGFERVVAIAGLGGGTGSGAISIMAEYAKTRGLNFIPCVTMPFDFEGNVKADIATSTLFKIKAFYPDVFTVHQQPLITQYSQARFKDALEMALYDIQQHIEDCVKVKTIDEKQLHDDTNSRLSITAGIFYDGELVEVSDANKL